MSESELCERVLAANNLRAALMRANDLDDAQRRIAGWLLDLREQIDHVGG